MNHGVQCTQYDAKINSNPNTLQHPNDNQQYNKRDGISTMNSSDDIKPTDVASSWASSLVTDYSQPLNANTNTTTTQDGGALATSSINNNNDEHNRGEDNDDDDEEKKLEINPTPSKVVVEPYFADDLA